MLSGGLGDAEGMPRDKGGMRLASARVLAIVPARGGSKGLARKNVRPFLGRPLIVHSIDAALGCPLVDLCVVSTEDAEIRSVALEGGARVIDRPPELATDGASSSDVVLHALDVLAAEGAVPDVVVLLQPTSPLRNAKHLTDCLDRFLASDAESSLSVTRVEHHPYKNFCMENGELIPLFNASYLHMPRQDLPDVFRQNGAIYAVRRDSFLRTHSFYVPPAQPYPMSQNESVDIDTLMEFEFAERVMSGAK